MTNKALLDSIEKDYGLDMTAPGIEMLAVFSPETLRRAEELQAPGVLRIIRKEEAPGELAAIPALCFLIGKQELIEEIKAPEDKI